MIHDQHLLRRAIFPCQWPAVSPKIKVSDREPAFAATPTFNLTKFTQDLRSIHNLLDGSINVATGPLNESLTVLFLHQFVCVLSDEMCMTLLEVPLQHL